MVERTDRSRRYFLGAAAATMAIAGGRSEARASSSFDFIKQIRTGVLDIGYADVGPRDGAAVILLHGWPYDIYSCEESSAILAAEGYRVIVPFLRGYGSTQFLSRDTPRNGQQSAMAQDVIDLMDALKIRSAVLGGFDWGSRTAAAVAALWPERCKGLVAVSGYLITNLALNRQPLPPAAEQGWWYQYYFSTERGRIGYEKNRYEFAKLIWKNASPKWKFDDATYDRSAKAFENPDHVAIVIHNYRWRLGLADGESRYDLLESRLQTAPAIGVPSITIGSDFDGAAANGKSYAAKFTGKYSHLVLDGIGHNVPQEAPKEFARAIVQVSKA